MARKGYIIHDQQAVFFLTNSDSSASNYAGVDQIIDVDCLFYAV